MKVLFISNYRDGTGWGNTGLNAIRSMHRAGINVVCRPITYNGRNLAVPEEVEECESKDLFGVDTCIQFTLPENYYYNSKLRQIGYYCSENTDFSHSKWYKYINIMDEAWVLNSVSKTDSMMSKVSRPIKVVHNAIDIESYKNFEPVSSTEALRHSFNFFFVGELIKRKNLGALLKAFHTEFHPSENVNLFLKISRPGLSPDETIDFFYKWHDSLTDGLKIRKKYKEPVLLAGFEPKESLLSLMSQCHCFVCSSYGEACCIPAVEAMALGKPVIYTSGIGLSDYVGAVGIPVKSREVNCSEARDSLPELYSSFDTWLDIDVADLQFQMRRVYEQYNDIDKEAIKKQAELYNLDNVGQEIKSALYGN